MSPRSRRTRILFVINSLAGGGAERVMSTLLRLSADRAQRYDIQLALLDDCPRAFPIPQWLDVQQFDCRGGMLRSIVAVERLVRAHSPDLTISFLTRANLATGIAMMRRGRPWIISERTSAPAHLGSPARQWTTKAMMRRIYSRASRVICVSAGVSAKMSDRIGVAEERIAIVPNPVDIDVIRAAAAQESGLEDCKPYIMALGRFVRVKNFELLIRSFAKANLPCRLVLAGDGPEREKLSSLALQWGVADRLVMTGWLENPYPALREASVFALSSNVEGFPNALVEALALGVPVVSTNCADGPAEILANADREALSGVFLAEAGILTPVDDVDSYAEALRLAFDPSVRARLTGAGCTRAQDYSAERIADEYWALIERELARTADGVVAP